MPSEIRRVSSPARVTVACAAVVLICLFGGASGSADAGPAKNKPAKASRPVFSVSAQRGDSGRVMPTSAAAPVLTGAAAKKTDTSSHAPDTARHGVKAVKDSAPSVQTPWTVQKKAPDTLNKPIPPAAMQQSSAPLVSPNQKQKQRPTFWKRIVSVRMLVLFLCAAVILAAIRFVKRQKTPPRFLTTTRLSVMDKEVQRACRYIEKNFADPDLSVKNVCRDLTTGEAFLEALMERDLGVSVDDFIEHVRINRARQILAKDPSADVDAVARETGFASDAAFRTAFIKLCGASFETYTQKYRKNT